MAKSFIWKNSQTQKNAIRGHFEIQNALLLSYIFAVITNFSVKTDFSILIPTSLKTSYLVPQGFRSLWQPLVEPKYIPGT